MRNLPSALVIAATIYVFSTTNEWWLLVLGLIIALLLADYLSGDARAENMRLLRATSDELEARAENIRWATKLSKSQVTVNLTNLALMRQFIKR